MQNNQFQEIEVDKKVLVDRICKLQRLHAKKNEKIEFMEEHINHLTEDLQKKSKLELSFFLLFQRNSCIRYGARLTRLLTLDIGMTFLEEIAIKT